MREAVVAKTSCVYIIRQQRRWATETFPRAALGTRDAGSGSKRRRARRPACTSRPSRSSPATSSRAGSHPARACWSSSVAAQFGISRAPARHALAELERCGLVEKATGRGYTVRPVAQRPGGSLAAAGVAARDDVRLISALELGADLRRGRERDHGPRRPSRSWRVNEAELARHYRVEPYRRAGRHRAPAAARRGPKGRPVHAGMRRR